MAIRLIKETNYQKVSREEGLKLFTEGKEVYAPVLSSDQKIHYLRIVKKESASTIDLSMEGLNKDHGFVGDKDGNIFLWDFFDYFYVVTE